MWERMILGRTAAAVSRMVNARSIEAAYGLAAHDFLSTSRVGLRNVPIAKALARGKQNRGARHVQLAHQRPGHLLEPGGRVLAVIDAVDVGVVDVDQQAAARALAQRRHELDLAHRGVGEADVGGDVLQQQLSFQPVLGLQDPCGHVFHRECVRSILHDYETNNVQFSHSVDFIAKKFQEIDLIRAGVDEKGRADAGAA